jgi:N-acetylglucosamine-6-phosphate deacetylase
VPASDLAGQSMTHETGGILAPGFIDLQVNGGGGVMLNNQPCRETVERIAAAHRATGTTGMLPTLISDRFETQQAAVEGVRAARDAGNPAILGIHLEGPFFEPARRGVHRADRIRPATGADLEWLCGLSDLPVVLTLAPEQFETADLERLAAAGLLLCAGHTNASYAQMQSAVDAGLRGVTHLFNAMSPLQSREPGTVGAALEEDRLWVGIIADGHHVHPASLRLACRSKPRGKVLLVTDAMATVGSDSDCFELYGERITLRDGRLVNAAGVLAGSAIGMIDAVRICHEQVGLPLAECLRMASLYPAQFLGLERQLGRLAPGHRADLVHFDEAFRVSDTWIAGQHQAHGV